jgi:hypothetical protein
MAEMIQSNPDAFRAGPAPPSPDAPPLGTSFDVVNFDENAANTGFYQIPPDPSGAVGPTHVVDVVNSTIEIHTKAGVQQFEESLQNFFTAPTPCAVAPSPAPTTITFDPKVIYDQYAGRFVVTTMERVEASPTNQSRVYFAVSDNSDPNGTWYCFALNTEETIGASQTWADFPGLAVDSEAIYYTNNQFNHNNQPSPGLFAGQRLRIVAKAPFYSGGAALATSYDPTALANANPNGDGAVATTMQPTQMYGDVPGGVGNYLMAYSGINNGTSVAVQMIQVDSPLSSPTFTGWFSLWGTTAADDNISLSLPSAPQLGSARTIATNDRRFSQHAVLRSGKLYMAAPIRPPSGTDAGQTTAHWFKIDPVTIATTASDPPPDDQGNIGGEDIAAGTHTFFPSVAVDLLGNLGIGFAASGPSIYPGAYYTGRLAGDPAGTVQPSGTLRAGVDYYIRDFSTSTVVASRWGDYSGIWLDPAGEKTMCVFNEYAMARGTVLPSFPEEDGRWRNAWGCFSFVPTAVDVTQFAATRTKSGVLVSWRTGAEAEMLGFNVYRSQPAKSWRKLNRTLIPAKASGAAVYRFLDRTAKRSKAYNYRLQIIDLKGKRSWHSAGAVSASS